VATQARRPARAAAGAAKAKLSRVREDGDADSQEAPEGATSGSLSQDQGSEYSM